MKRPDITDDLVHFIRGASLAESFRVLTKILAEQSLTGGAGFIRGGHRCVCFSEAPVDYLGFALERSLPSQRPYQPVGILLAKEWLFRRGGRPVIYQPDAEYDLLVDEQKWRHVRYDPAAEARVDFSWEREWRIRIDALEFEPNEVQVVVPSREVARWLHNEHARDESYNEQMHTIIFDQMTAWQLRKDFTWTLRVLELDQVA
jgi:hypothetical protein